MYIILFCAIAIVLLVVCIKQTVTFEPFYQTLNMSSGESPYKCRSCKREPTIESFNHRSCKYGPTFNYKAQKSDRTYGVPNGCQTMF